MSFQSTRTRDNRSVHDSRAVRSIYSSVRLSVGYNGRIPLLMVVCDIERSNNDSESCDTAKSKDVRICNSIVLRSY